MAEIVYNIQQPQGTQERTVEQPGIDMSQLYRVAGQEAEAGLNSIGKIYSKISEDKKKTKDYGPLVRALQDYNDTITAENLESAEEQKIWDDLVRWAAPFYSSDEIRSWSERTGTKIYTDRLDTMRKAEVANKQIIDENLQSEAMLRYPGMPAREAKEKYFNEISDTLNAINTLKYNSARTPEDAERVTMLSYGPLLKAVSNQIADAKAARGGAAFSSAEFGVAITDSFNWLREQGVPVNIASLITSTVTDLYKADVEAGDAQLKGVVEAGKNYTAMVESEAKLRDLYTNDVVRNIKVRLGGSEVPLSAVKSLRDLAGELIIDNMLAELNGTGAYAKLAEDLSTGLGDLSPEQTAQLYTDVASAGVRGIAANTISELNARYIAGSKTIRSFADSAKNPEQKTSIAMTLDSAMKMLTPAIKDDPRSSLLGSVMLSNQNLKSIPQEMLQQHPELMSIAKDRFERDTDLFAAKLNNTDMQSILPIFDKSGDLKFYTFSKDDKGYSFKDIGDGYSWFGDAKVIQGTPERAGLKAMMTDYIEKTTNNTGLSPKEVKDMWNIRMLELTDIGGRMYYGQDITSRFSNGLWGTKATGESPDITDEQANELLGYILEGKGVVPITTVKNSIYPQGTRAVVDTKNNTVYLEAPQGSSTELKAPEDGTLVATSTPGVFEFREKKSGVTWTLSNVLASSVGDYNIGDIIAYKDTNNMEGVTIGVSTGNIISMLNPDNFAAAGVYNYEQHMQPVDFKALGNDAKDFFREVWNISSKGYKGAVDITEKTLDQVLFNTSKEDLLDIVYNTGELIKNNVNTGAEKFIDFLEGPVYEVVDDSIKMIIPSKKGKRTITVEEEDLREKAKTKFLNALKSGDYSEIPLTRIMQRQDEADSDVLIEQPTISPRSESDVPLFEEDITVPPIVVQVSQGYAVLPSVRNGVKLSDEEAIEFYNRTGEHYGIYRSLDAALRHATSVSK